MDKQISIEGQNIFYRVRGSGQPVMLVHGFGEDGEVWRVQAAILEKKFQLIIPDLPGSGRSTMDNGTWSMDRFADILKFILDTEKISSCIIIGHSMGGYITMAFVEKYPGYLTALGLFHSTAFPDTEEKKVNRLKGIDFIKQHGAFPFLQTTSPNLFSPTSKSAIPAKIDEFIAGLSNFTAEALVWYYKAMIARPDRVSLLKIVKLPVLFVFGEYDTAVQLSDGLKQCHLPEISYIHILKNSGHMGMMEQPDEATRILDDFLKKL